MSQQAQQRPFGTLTYQMGCVSVLYAGWSCGGGRDLQREICGPLWLSSAWTLVLVLKDNFLSSSALPSSEQQTAVQQAADIPERAKS